MRQIQLTQGKITLVSDRDYTRVSHFSQIKGTMDGTASRITWKGTSHD